MSLPRKLLLSAAILVGLLGLAELGARLVTPADDPLARHGEIVRVLGLPELNALLEPDPDCFWRLVETADAHRVQGTIDGRPMDFRVSVRDHRRVVPPAPEVPGSAREKRVLFLGDSCTFGVGVDDAESVPAVAARLLAERLVPIEALDAGVPGYSAFQGRRWLETRGEALAPDVVVATFGFNDFDRWGSLSDLEQARRRSGALGRLLAGSRLVRRLSTLGPRPADRPRLLAEEFALELYGIARWCAERQVPLVLAIWPWREQVEQRVTQHVAYQGVVLQVAHDQGTELVDLVPRFVGSGQGARALFLDHVHASPAGCALAAEALVEPLVRALERRP